MINHIGEEPAEGIVCVVLLLFAPGAISLLDEVRIFTIIYGKCLGYK